MIDKTVKCNERIENGLDPDIDRFIKKMGEGWSSYPPLNSLPVVEARKVAEAVRKPWTEGGPQMTQTIEEYVDCDGEKIRIRIYDPGPGGVAKPVLVYLHGGGWTIFGINTHDRVMREYAGRAGIYVVGVDYSLSPEVEFPRALDETAAVVRWLGKHGERYAIDPERISIGGDSAGANLAVAAAVILRDEGEQDAIKGMLLNYGAYDTDCANSSYKKYGGPGYMLGDTEMEDFWKSYLGARFEENIPLAKPLYADLCGLPSALLVIPDCDVLCDENLAMNYRLRSAGVQTKTIIYEGASHSFLEAVSIADIAEEAHRDSANWLKETLKP